jgi:hypothetical protein
MTRKEELTRRAAEYCQQHGLALSDELGFGIHGIVYATESYTESERSPLRSAIKVHERDAACYRERDIYLRLKELAVTQIRGCEVPRLIRFDDKVWIIEMTIVVRPFVLDFAGAYLDHAPDFSEEVLADWRAEKQEQFGSRGPRFKRFCGFSKPTVSTWRMFPQAILASLDALLRAQADRKTSR